MKNKPKFNEESCAAILTIGIFCFALMPIIGTIWILVKGWDNTPQWVKVLWILSLIAVAYGVISFIGSLISDKVADVSKSIQRNDIQVSATEWDVIPDRNNSTSGSVFVKVIINNSSSKTYEIDLSSHAIIKTINPEKGSCEYSDCSYQLIGSYLIDPVGRSKYILSPHSTTTISMTGEYSAFWIDSTSASMQQLCIFAGESEWILNPNISCY